MKLYRTMGVARGKAVKTLQDGSTVELDYGSAWQPVGPVYVSAPNHEAALDAAAKFYPHGFCTECEEAHDVA